MDEEGYGSEKVVEVYTYTTRCPVCNNDTLRLSEYLYDMPRIGKVILTVGKCSYCGYRYSDVRLAEYRGPRRITFRVEDPNDINTLIVKSSSAKVVVKELELEMMPGPSSQGFITSIEGVLQRFKEAVEIACKDPEADSVKCRNLMDTLERAMRGEEKLTIIVIDPEGVSAIDSPKALVEELGLETENSNDLSTGSTS